MNSFTAPLCLGEGSEPFASPGGTTETRGSIGPSADSDPAVNGIAIVVDGVGANWPRIQIEISPLSFVHSVPAFLMSLLDWKDGYFELSSGGTSQIKPELEGSITHLLLEHARLRDEAR